MEPFRPTVRHKVTSLAGQLGSEGLIALRAGRATEAEAKLTEAITVADRDGPAADETRWSALNALSLVHLRHRRYDAAELALDAAVAVVIRQGWRGIHRHLTVLTNVALLHWERGQRTEALGVLGHAYNAAQAHSGTVADQRALAGILRSLIG